jgi:hypothetical protein
MRYMDQFYVVGGKQKSEIMKDWEQYKAGVILNVIPQKRKVEKCVEYISPAIVCPLQNPSITFTAATLQNNLLYVATQTEVIIFSLSDFSMEGYITLPCFHEIHHVLPLEKGKLLVANTGLDMVLEVSQDGDILRVWNVLGKENPWDRFSPFVDYRIIPTTRPHESHPNYVFKIAEDIWVTRCLQKDAICLTNPDLRIEIGRELVHDGVIHGNLIYFTQVDGHVVVVDKTSLQIVKDYNLNEITRVDTSLGWCRGIEVLDQDKVIVGFTRIRPSKNSQSSSNSYGILPTRVVCYDLKEKKQLWDMPLESFGINAIYSIHEKKKDWWKRIFSKH